MNSKLLLLLAFSTTIKAQEPWEGLIPAGNQYIVGDSRGRMLRIAFRTSTRQEDFAKESDEFKMNYAKTNFFEPSDAGEKVIKLYLGDKTKKEFTDEITDDFDLTISNNPKMVATKEIMHAKFVAKKSYEPFEACIVLKGNLPYGDKDPVKSGGKTLSTFCNAIKARGQWVVGFNWEGLGFVVFSILKIIMILASLAMIFVRPFFPKYAKLKFAWVGQSVILFQLLMYSPLTTGSFGGVIDELHKGMIKASRRVFFVKITPNFNKTFRTESAFAFQVYKYYDYDLVAAITEELIIGTVALLVMLIVTGIVNLGNNERVKRIVNEMKSCLGLVYFVPFTVFFFYNLFMYSISSNFLKFWSIVNTVISIIFLIFYAITIMRMVTTVYYINYLHGRAVYQEGKVDVEQGSDWAFDTFPSMNTNVWIRVLEFMILILLGPAYVSTYEWGVLAPFAILVYWIVLIAFTINKLKTFEGGTDEREATFLVSKITLIIYIFRFLEFLILGILNAIRMKLSGIKVLTWIYMIVILFDIVAILIQLALRVNTLTKKPDYIRDMIADKKRKRQIARYHEEEKKREAGEGTQGKEENQNGVENNEEEKKINDRNGEKNN